MKHAMASVLDAICRDRIHRVRRTRPPMLEAIIPPGCWPEADVINPIPTLRYFVHTCVADNPTLLKPMTLLGTDTKRFEYLKGVLAQDRGWAVELAWCC